MQQRSGVGPVERSVRARERTAEWVRVGTNLPLYALEFYTSQPAATARVECDVNVTCRGHRLPLPEDRHTMAGRLVCHFMKPSPSSTFVLTTMMGN